jgi:hypothetical protein
MRGHTLPVREITARIRDTALVDYYRVAEDCPQCRPPENLKGEDGYFLFGSDTVCYGRMSSGPTAKDVTQALYDASRDVIFEDSAFVLPFEISEVIDNLRNESYRRSADADKRRIGDLNPDGVNGGVHKLVRGIYYSLRPLLPVEIRKHLQRVSFRNWDRVPFPRWPVDSSVDQILERTLALSLKAHPLKKVPFIWFWPEGYDSCLILTHDIETRTGLDFCRELMDIDDSAGFKASFQLIPEGRYHSNRQIRAEIRNRGFEVNIHDLNHDGRLFSSRKQFLACAPRINEYGKQFEAFGFRSGGLYRNIEWLDVLAFSYDMSVPNVGHLEAQGGGCCTVMPYFIGDLVELPLTTTQDYSLFHILGDYSIDIWKRQVALIRDKHGLISFNIHPDYIIAKQPRQTYAALLSYLGELRTSGRIWTPLPGELNRWWRERSQMKLLSRDGKWYLEGLGAERARIAWASLDAERVTYSF